MQDYVVKTEGFILGTFHNRNKVITLADAQAKTFLREGRIEVRQATPKEDPKSQAR